MKRTWVFSMLLPFAATGLLNCGNGQKQSVEEKPQQKNARTPLVVHQKIAPNSCRIVATVLSIDNDWRTSNAKDPCSKAPCRATVRVDSVLGYGSAARPIGVGENLSAHFKFTLHPSMELFPNMNLNLPRLDINSRFRADVTSNPRLDLGEADEPSLYIVETYKKLN